MVTTALCNFVLNKVDIGRRLRVRLVLVIYNQEGFAPVVRHMPIGPLG